MKSSALIVLAMVVALPASAQLEASDLDLETMLLGLEVWTPDDTPSILAASKRAFKVTTYDFATGDKQEVLTICLLENGTVFQTSAPDDGGYWQQFGREVFVFYVDDFQIYTNFHGHFLSPTLWAGTVSKLLVGSASLSFNFKARKVNFKKNCLNGEV